MRRRDLAPSPAKPDPRFGGCRVLATALFGASAFLLFASSVYSGQAVVRDNFDGGSGGWTVLGDAQGTSVQPTYRAGGGNPGGYVEARDNATGGIWYWNAPPTVCSALKEAWASRGQRVLVLTFDLRQSDTRSPFTADDVVLAGGGVALGLSSGSAPGTSWTSYKVPVELAKLRNRKTQKPATQQELTSVMSSLTSLWIRGEYRTGDDTGGLDNMGWQWQPAPPSSPSPPGIRSVGQPALQIRFTDAKFRPLKQAVVQSIRQGDPGRGEVWVEVIAPRIRKGFNDKVVETISVTVRSAVDPRGETVQCIETAPGSRVFRSRRAVQLRDGGAEDVRP